MNQHKDIDQNKFEKWNKNKEEIEKNKKQHIERNKEEMVYEISKKYKIRSLLEIKEKYLPKWINYSYVNFLEEYPKEFYDYFKVYQFISDCEYPRCQYQLRGYEIKKYLDDNSNLNDIDNFIKQKNNTSEKSLDELHKSCNLFLYFINLYIKHKEIVTEKTNSFAQIFLKAI